MTVAGGKWKHYLAIGEEAARGTAEKTTVGFIPLNEPFMPKPEYNDQEINEYRGEDRGKGPNEMRRFDSKWSGSLDMPIFCDSGTVTKFVGTMLKHFFGDVTSTQNGGTGQYVHTFYPNTAPFDTGATLVAKALTLNSNWSYGSTVKNNAYTGGRFNKLTISQEQGQLAKAVFEAFGQTLDDNITLISTPTFADEDKGLRPSNLSVYNGAGITRGAGTPPAYTTSWLPNTMNQLKPETISIEIENGWADSLRFDGNQYPDKTETSVWKYTLNMKIDWEVPSSGFDSTAEWVAWNNAIGNTPFLIVWDTGTEAGSGGDNYGIKIDLPMANRVSPDFDLSQIGAKKIDLKYEGLVDLSTTTYLLGMQLINEDSAV